MPVGLPQLSRVVVPLLLLVALPAALLFLSRLLVAPFSRKIQEQMRKHPWLHVIWSGLVPVASYLFYLVAWPSAWPPEWLERHNQRQEVLRRIQSAGGWAALKRDCDALAAGYNSDRYHFEWSSGNTNSLPGAIAALRPTKVEFYPRKVLDMFRSGNIPLFGSNLVVRITIFGFHATGGRDQQWLGLDVVCEPGLTNYNPVRRRFTPPWGYWRYRKVAPDIYEDY